MYLIQCEGYKVKEIKLNSVSIVNYWWSVQLTYEIIGKHLIEFDVSSY